MEGSGTALNNAVKGNQLSELNKRTELSIWQEIFK